MSGIVGIWQRDGQPLQMTLLQSMAGAAAHRGPDGISFWSAGPAGLAHLAFRTTPEALRERQPTANRAGTCWITAQARIDNRAELLQAFAGHGLELAQPTDVDLILAAYDLWGQACAGKLLGDFAFIIWDSPRRCMFGARDPFGVRPFYYYAQPNRFACASEVKQLLADPALDRTLNLRVLGAHLCTVSQPANETFYAAANQLERGHALLVSEAGLRTWSYSSFLPEREIRYRRETEYAEHLRDLFTDAVRVRLRSTTPVCIKLSGGIDSAAITAVAAHLARREAGTSPVFALHATYDELPSADEQRFARPLIAFCGIPATYLPGDGLWPYRDYPACPPDLDEPDSSVYSYWNRSMLRAAATGGACVVLSGYWGDAVLQGSRHGLADLLAELRLGEWWRSVHRFHRDRGKTYRQLVVAWSLRPLAPSWLERRYRAWRPKNGSLLPPWVEPEFARRMDLAALCELSPTPPESRWRARAMIYRNLVMDIGPRGTVFLDRLALQEGIDYRFPFTDLRLVRFALAVPPDLWFRNGVEKVLMRQAIGDLLPDVVRNRTQVVLPTALFERSMREREVSKIQEVARCPGLSERGVVDNTHTARRYQRYVEGEIAVEHPLSWTLNAEMWLAQHFALR